MNWLSWIDLHHSAMWRILISSLQQYLSLKDTGCDERTVYLSHNSSQPEGWSTVWLLRWAGSLALTPPLLVFRQQQGLRERTLKGAYLISIQDGAHMHPVSAVVVRGIRKFSLTLTIIQQARFGTLIQRYRWTFPMLYLSLFFSTFL